MKLTKYKSNLSGYTEALNGCKKEVYDYNSIINRMNKTCIFVKVI